MKSNAGKSSNFNNYDFDFGLGSGSSSNRSQPLNGKKQQNSPYTHITSSSSAPSVSQPKPAWNPNKPSWTHQPLPTQTAQSGISNPTSMVGDIFGKSWGSAVPSSGSTTSLGIPEKNPNLFGDLVGSALGQGKGNSSVPLKNAAPVQTKSSFSMGKLADSLPKNTSSATKNNSNWGIGDNIGSFSSVNHGTSNGIKTGGPSIRSGGALGSANKDPFGSLLNFGSKKESSTSVNAAPKNVSTTEDYSFGDFQNAAKPTTPSFPSNQFPSTNNSTGSNAGSGPKVGNFGDFDIPIQDFSSQKQPPPQSKGVDPLDMLFSSSSSTSTSAAPGGPNSQNQPFSEMEDWDNLGPDFGGDDVGNTTELEGLPPPPAGVTASTAKNKGLGSQKQGQHADAIKWLSWAVVLLEKSGDSTSTIEVLSSRASCYKEVGEYKKAVADCSKVLEQDPENVDILVQRALLYESTEKYKLGAEDLRTVLKIDPGNRLARSTIHRLTKMAE